MDIQRDAQGHERVAGEALMSGRQSDIDAAVAHGYRMIAQQTISSLDRTVARLGTPDGKSLDQAIAELHQLAPRAIVTSNTIYRGAQANMSFMPRTPRPTSTPLSADLGVIDTGADASALASPNALIASRSFAQGAYTPREHGTFVASIATNLGMRVRVADVFGVSADGSLAASADAIIGALDWMLASNVAVINISIEGPRNAILENLIRTASQRGHIIVAAAGNGGPLAAPAFPAAYPGAVAVTAVDDTGHAYRRANRGPYVAFAAAGVDVPVEISGRGVTVSGTSFSSPIVASHLALMMRAPSPTEAQRALRTLQRQAVDLGAPGRDPVFGWGAIRAPN